MTTARTGPTAAGARPGGDTEAPAVAPEDSSEWGQPNLDATPSSKEAAQDAFKRGEKALKREDIATAVEELRQACELNPKHLDYLATYAWAKFCAAPDKEKVAQDTRKTLEKVVHKSEKPEIGRFFLGRVERMLGRDREALRHFNEVLLLVPNHREAASEVRIIEARLSANSKR